VNGAKVTLRYKSFKAVPGIDSFLPITNTPELPLTENAFIAKYFVSKTLFTLEFQGNFFYIGNNSLVLVLKSSEFSGIDPSNLSRV
jgi:hypothetical protein